MTAIQHCREVNHVSKPQRIPRPRHLFPELAGFFIEWKRTNLRATRSLRRAIGHVPIWVTGSLAGIAGIMLAISLFFVQEHRLQAAATVSTPPASTPPTFEPEPTPAIMPVIAPKPNPRLSASLLVTHFPFEFDENRISTTTSTPFQSENFASLRYGDDPWRIAQTRSQLTPEFHSYLLRAAGMQTTWPKLTASEIVPDPPESPALRIQGVRVEKSGDMNGTPHEPLTYQLVVRNTSPFLIENVSIREQISSIARVTDVIPAAGVAGNELVWNIDQLSPDAARTFQITLMPEREGIIETMTQVIPTSRVSAVVQVQNPARPAEPARPVQQPAPAGAPELRLTYTEVKPLKQGDILSMIFAVENVGTAPAQDVVLYVRLSGQFEHRYGEFVKHTIGTLPPGQMRRALLQATARDPGDAQLNASLTMGGVEIESRHLNTPIQSMPNLPNAPQQSVANRQALTASMQWLGMTP